MNELMTIEESKFFTTLQACTTAEKKEMYNVISSPDYRISDYVGKKITIKDVVAEMIELTDEETGEVVEVPRIIIVDDKKKTYACVSNGIFKALKRVFDMFGMPSEWDEPITVEVVLKQLSNNRSTFNFKIV